MSGSLSDRAPPRDSMPIDIAYPDDLLGRIVVSKTGRDAGRPLVVIMCSECGKWIWVADGDLRKSSKPKKKNIAHLRFIASYATKVRNTTLEGKIPADKLIRTELSHELCERTDICPKTRQQKKNR